MTRDNLVQRAKTISQPSPDSAAAFETIQDKALDEMNRRMESRADVRILVGEDGIQMMRDNHQNHARFLSSLFVAYSPEVFVDTVLWVFRAYRSHGFSLAYWPAQLAGWVDVLKEILDEAAWVDVEPFYDFMLVNQPSFAMVSGTLDEPGEASAHGMHG